MNTIEIIAALKSHKVTLRLAGDQLKLVGETAILPAVLVNAVKTRKEELIELLKNVAGKTDDAVIQKIQIQQDYPASDAQKSLWALNQLDGTGGTYNITLSLYLKGVVYEKILNNALKASIQRHESLRTVFKEVDGELRQVILDHIMFETAFEDITDLIDIDNHLIAELKKLTYWQFDLENGPLLKVKLMRISDGEYALLMVVHHIISDGWSVRILLNEMMRFYKAYRNDEDSAIDPLKIQYKDFADWLSRKLDGNMGRNAKDFWKNQFLLDVNPLVLPSDFIRSGTKTFEGAIAKFSHESHFYDSILDFCKKNKTTLFNFFHTTFIILLNKLSGQSAITIGVPVSGRTHFDLQNQIGLFVNTLPLTTHINVEDRFTDILKLISENSLGAFEFQNYPFGKIVEDVIIQRDASRNPLFDVMLVLQDTAVGDGRISFNNGGDFELCRLDNYLHEPSQTLHKSAPSKFDLTFNFGSDLDNKLYLEIEYSTSLFTKDNITLFYNAYQHIISQVLEHPEGVLKNIELVKQEERHRLLEEFNATVVPYALDKTIIDLFEEQVAKTPEKVALLFDETALTYNELNERSNQLASYLRTNYSVKAGDLIGIQLQRNEWLVISMLAVLKSGGAYVPIDPAYPQERIDYIVADSQCKVVLDEKELRQFHADANNYSIENPVMVIQPTDLAYVIYTSGSTGHPKGVMITHSNVYAFMEWCKEEFSASAYEVVLGVTSVCFDLSVFEIFYTLVIGKELRLLRDALAIPQYLDSEAPLLLNTVPSVISSLLSAGADFSQVSVLNMAGEPIPASTVRQLDCNRMEVRNLYGPSEDTTYSTVYRIKGADKILIGRPISNTRIYILNDQGRLQPEGVSGEICISGAGLARGYLNQPELTAEKFVPHPFIAGERLYKTGDLGKWQSDGNVVYLGRKDDQVKVRGYRIELGEIEHILQQHASIKAAVVMAIKDSNGDDMLVAYTVSETEVNVSDTRSWLSSKLPHYMLPACFVQLDSLPLLPNGKLNKKALPAPEGEHLTNTSEYEAPRNETEAQLVQIWQDILDREQVGVKDNFFELGGHSLKATRLASRIYKVLEVKISLQELFTHTVLEDQARLIAVSQKTSYTTIPEAAKQTDYPLSSSQRRLWVLSQFEEGSVAYNMPGVFEFAGTLDTSALATSFDTLIERHESLRTVFREREDREIRQHILLPAALGFKIGYHDLSNEDEGTVRATVETSLSQPFDLEHGPLLRADIYQTGDHKWMFSYVMHHIISDGWSMEVLIKELLQLYNAFVQDQPDLLSSLRINYKDYAVWQQGQLSNAVLNEHKSWWLQQLSGEIPVLELPADKVRPAVKTYNGASLSQQIHTGTTAGLKALCHSSDSTLFMGLLAAMNVLLYRYTGQDDIIIGSPVAGREHSDLEDQIGFYVNTLALRTQLSGTENYEQLLTRTRQLTLDAYQHQSYPFDELVEELNLQRDMSRSALFDVLIVLQHHLSTAVIEKGLTGLQVRTYKVVHEQSKFDLQFNFTEEQDMLALKITYNTDIYSQYTITQLLTHFEQLLGAIITDPTLSIAELEYLSIAEQTHLLTTFNATDVDYTSGRTVVDLFEEQVLRKPDDIGLLYEERSFSYRQLNGLANQLAHYLKERYAISSNDLVGIQLQRNEWLVISMLAVLKSGGAYVPIDPAYPQERIDYIVADSQCKVVLDEKELRQFHADANNYSIENPVMVIQPTDLAYVIYTSGSTGHPKGVMITHSNVYAFMEWCKEEFSASAYEVVLGVTSVCFDLSVFEIFYTLVIGKELRLLRDALAIPQYLDSEAPLLLNTVPSVISSLLSAGADFSQVSVLNMAGEPIPASTVRQLDCNRMEVRNLYGPSEDTTYSTVYRIKGADKILIGRPISNTRIYILNDQGRLQPEGVSGEICISGAGLARGYLNQPELTAEKFVPHPFIAGERLYKTGDFGKWQSDGNVVYLGRKDDQVKVRGYRIELGEIENAVQHYSGVTSAVVTAITENNGDKALAAYIVSDTKIKVSEISSWLSLILPHYMLPAYFIQLDALPLLPNGKINRKSLPAPETMGFSAGVDYVEPRNQVEKELVGIWQDILGREQVGVKDNFFELGGHSLKATRLASQIHKKFEVKVELKELFTHPVLEDQAKLIAQSQKTFYIKIPEAAEQTDYILSSSQRRLWVLSQFEEGSVAYNMPGVFEFAGTLDINAFSKSFDTLIERHESLRTVFRERADGEIRQHILSPAALGFRINKHDLYKADYAVIKQAIQTSLSQPFDLSAGPLLRADLYQTGDHKWMFSYVMHHIISDGWSMEVLIKELLQLYNAFVQDEPNPLSPLRIHYKDYAVWQQEQLNRELSQPHKDYWLAQLSGELPVLELPADKVRPAVKTYNGASLSRQMHTGTTVGLKALCLSSDSTLFMGVLAAVNALLYRYTGQDDIIIGSPVAGREHSDLEYQIGFYVNTLALRTQFSGSDSYQQLLARIKQTTLDAYAYQSYPFDSLVEELDLQRDLSRNALFDVLVVMQHQSSTSLVEKGLTGLQVKTSKEMGELSKFDLQFNFLEVGDQLHLHIIYNTDIYYSRTIAQLASHFEQLLGDIITAPEKAIGTLEYLSVAEQTHLLTTFNATDVAYTLGRTVVDLFEEQVAKTPEKVALLFDETALTYNELNEKSNQLASYLRTNYSVKAGDLIGIWQERNEWLVVSMLAVLKSGGAYVPIDPAYPQERIDYIIADSQCKVVLDEKELRQFHADANNYSIENPVMVIQPTDLAYVIYTSGSTGKPKGVMIMHSNVYAFMEWCKEEFSASGYEVVLGVTSVCFDLSVFEIFYTLVIGKELRLLRDALAIPQYLDSEAPLLLNTVPSVISSLLSAGADFSQVSVLNMAGEPIPASTVRQLDCNRMEVRNLYGPSEDTTYSTVYRIKGADKILIGRPISNTRIYILNDQGRLQPEGVSGEICISGAGLARGYLNQPELTAEKFVPHPFIAGERLYKTGDLGKWQSDGNVVYLGRKDDQVKVRGYRIELGEIENTLHRYAGVTSAVVTAITEGDGDKVLVAYVAGKEPVDKAALRSHVKSSLPDYMVPHYYIQLDVIPLLPNGKVNRKALPAPEGEHLTNTSEYEAPRNETEAQLVQIWQDILGREQVGVKDHFFELGGHSLKATRLASRIYKVLEVKISLQELFTHTVLEDQARLIAVSQKTSYTTIPEAAKQTDYPLSSSQRRLWVLSQFEEGSVAYNMPGVFEFAGTLDTSALATSFDTLIERHESLRTVFREREDREIRQHILLPAALGFKIGYHDLSNEDEGTVRATVETSLSQPFDLEHGPLLRADIYQTGDHKWMFSYVMHHIISDGWSMEVLIKELLQLYDVYVKGKANPLSPLRIHYKDYAVWQQEQLNEASFQQHRKYWLQHLEGELPVLDFPSDKIRPAVKTYNGASLHKQISADITISLKKLCQAEQSTLFMGLLAAVNVLLYRYTSQEDIIIGSPMAGREHSDLDGQIGFYLNTLALRTQFSGSDSYQQLLARIKQTTLDAYAHQSYPFDSLVEELNLQRDMSRSALFDVLIVLQHHLSTAVIEKGLTGLEVRTYKAVHEQSKFDLQFNFTEERDMLALKITYNTDIYSQYTITQLLTHFEQLLTAILAAPGEAIATLTYLNLSEQTRLLEVFNNINGPYSLDKTVIDLFDEQVLRTPDAASLVYNGKTLNYRELNEAVNQLAHYLKQVYDVLPDDLIGIKQERSEWMIISLLAILKSGAAFVPIDPGYPQERIAHIVADSGCRVVIDEKELNQFRATAGKYSTENPVVIIRPTDLAYVIYTSGSTGYPKGVMISHAALNNYIRAIDKAYGIDEQERILQVSNFAFDAAVEQIMLSMLNGASLYVISQGLVTDIAGLTDYIATNNITHLHSVPTLLQHIDFIKTPALKRVISAGEECPVSLPRKVGGSTAFYNKYGPTETTISATLYRSTGEHGYQKKVPIGCPLDNSRVYILNDHNELQPIGVTGEICIGGHSLAQGYLHQPDLTASKFINDPYRPGQLIYRTGDLGKWLPDGNIVFIGRKDDQVKIRGHRIELGEIIQVLQGYEGVEAAVVTAIKGNNGDNTLVAYIIVNGSQLNITDVRNWLASKLPHYIVPAHFIQLDALPLLPNGKVNKKALPAPEDMASATSYVAPRNEIEMQLAEIWQQVLGLEKVGVQHNFFELGGHSLNATRLAGQVQKEFGINVNIKDVFLNPTIETVGGLIRARLWLEKSKNHSHENRMLVEI